ncbi:MULTISPECIES: hypothetical protein [Nostocales]|uniref:Uncharacterized protein n=2 Tax=Nostocales TaxID=1161 RepID=A0A8S9T564_9CYAN|nr:hypothetical protein [Tolypothrix bouteillei]KAF3886752.1 hypothetical protein DA73_0400015630 [Tolypothrix bouteillei VB521301]
MAEEDCVNCHLRYPTFSKRVFINIQAIVRSSQFAFATLDMDSLALLVANAIT